MIRNRLFSSKLMVVGLLFLISSSCVKFPAPNPGPNPGTTIPASFNWKTVQEVSLNVQVNSLSGIGDNYIRVIKIYGSPMLKDGSLIASGPAKPGTPYIVKVTLPTALPSVYVQEVLPTGKKTVQKVDISSLQLNVTMNSSSSIAQPVQKIASNASFTSPSIPIPTNYDVIVNNNNTLALTGFAPGTSSVYGNLYKSYYIPSGFNRTTTINMGNSVGHAILYVKGSLTLSGSLGLNKVSLVILDGGSVSIKGMTTGVFVETIPIIYVQQNATLSSIGIINMSDGIRVVNKGNFSLNQSIDINNGVTFYNEGTITVTSPSKKSYGISITNSALLYNSGVITSKTFDLTSNASVVNDVEGKITVASFYQSNGSVLNNHHEIVATADYSMSGGGTVNNFCNISANLTDLQGAVINLSNGSLWETQTTKLNNMTFNMDGGSMFLTGNMTNVYAMRLLSSSSEYSVFKCTGNVPDLRYAASQVNGKIEFVHANLVVGSSGTNGSLLYDALFNNNGSILSKVQTKNILSSACNDGAGQIEEPPPVIIDNDGDGVAAELDIDDNDANVAFVSYFPNETTWGTFAFEDLWPFKGDYDLNDLVLGFHFKYFTNASGKVTKLKFDYNIRAAGSSKDLSAAFQLDKVSATNISSITRDAFLGTEPFEIDAKGVEKNVTLAVIPLFNKVDDIVTTGSDYFMFLNTLPGGNHVTTQNRSIEIRFIVPVEFENLSIYDDINFFIVTNIKGEKARGKEIHLSSFLPTSKADPSFFIGAYLYPTDKYKFIDGMMWGLMIPIPFEYPAEYNSIESTYLHFREWALSTTNEFEDWYSNTSEGYRNESMIYSY